MRWIRSFPATIPPHRAYIVDELPRFINSDYDYTGLGAIDDDICLIEWDIACSQEDMRAFEQSAALTPSYVLVAPHKLYVGRNGEGVWAHRRVLSGYRDRWVVTGETQCELFAFGLIYLPRALVRAFLDSAAPERGRWPTVKPGDYTDSRFTDVTFSTWHCFRSNRRPYHEKTVTSARIAWHVSPVHLHYPLEGVQHESRSLPVPILSGAAVPRSGL